LILGLGVRDETERIPPTESVDRSYLT